MVNRCKDPSGDVFLGGWGGVPAGNTAVARDQPLRWADPIANRETRCASRSLTSWEIIS